MGVHVEHRKIGPAEWLAPGGLTRVFAQGRIQNVGAAPGSIPDIRINLGVPGEGIFLPLIPRHGAINSRERPDQSLIQRRPYPAGNLGTGFHLPNAMRYPVGTVADLDCSNW